MPEERNGDVAVVSMPADSVLRLDGANWKLVHGADVVSSYGTSYSPWRTRDLHVELINAVRERNVVQRSVSGHRAQYSLVLQELLQKHQQACTPENLLQGPEVNDKSKTVFFFDFDDTLMATSYFEQHELFAMGEAPVSDATRKAEAAAMESLDEMAAKVLEEADKYGKTLIVTNAGKGWVEMASSQYLPRLRNYLLKKETRVISARSKYSAMFPLEVASEWKVQCFSDELMRMFPEKSGVNMLVFGDSISDQYAAHCSFARLQGQSLLKFVKFSERPTPSHLAYQLSVLRENLKNLVLHTNSFDVNVSKSEA